MMEARTSNCGRITLLPIRFVKIATIIHASGFLAFLDDFLYLPEVLYVLILFWLLFSGPGPYSVDSMMARWVVSPASTGH
jgi:hypothetical protein